MKRIWALVRARWRRPKDWLPKSLFGRALLIIVLPVAVMQVAVTWAFFDAHWETVTSRLSEGVAGDIAVALSLYEQAGPEGRVSEIDPFVRRTMGISIALEPGARLPTTVRSSFFRVLDRTLRRALSDKLEDSFWFDTTRYPAYVEVQVAVEAGVLRFIIPRDRVFATTGHIFILWILLATTLLTGVSLIYIRNQAKPIERLAAAAERFGRGQDAPDFRPAGAREVRQAAQAFMKMRTRILRHIDQRTTILAGVSHDLRTPLTRFRLQLALMPDGAEKRAMTADIKDMQAILDEYLDFARGVGGEDAKPVDVAALVQEVGEQAAALHREDPTRVEAAIEDTGEEAPPRPFTMTIREGAIRRCLQNLVTNAAAHGDQVRLTVRRASHAVEIDVEDDGPGIAADEREAVFRPFHQLQTAPDGDSRGAANGHGAAVRTSGKGPANRAGVGLGLAIARDAARSHGGDIVLDDSPLGGLRARVRLPAPATDALS